MIPILVVETSYLCEMYRVPGFSDATFSSRLQERWDRMAREQRASFYVPLGCLYQLCDHIADVPDGNQRRRLANQVVADVESALDRGSLWTILPTQGLDELPGFLRAFASDPGHLRLGLTNSDVLKIASDLSSRYGSSSGYRVHIWTRNRSLKTREPDSEPNPLL